MALFIVLMAYGFGFACILNFIIMQVRAKTADIYTARAKRIAALRGSSNNVEENAGENEENRPLKVTVLHPDLGIGGAERLIVDLVVGLQSHQTVRKMDVRIVTTHHDPQRCFKETADGTVKVVVSGDWIPAAIFGRCKVACACLRMAVAAFTTTRSHPDTDVFVVDQVAAVMPVLNFFAPCTPVLFYCHFPDQRCDPNRNDDGTYKTDAAAPTQPGAPPGGDGSSGSSSSSTGGPSSAHKSYRNFFDGLEAIAMENADSIVCNSHFSRHVTVTTFPELKDKISEVDDVFYPPVAPIPSPAAGQATEPAAADEELASVEAALSKRTAFVSINRYERKKNVLLAVEAFAKLLETMKSESVEAATALQLIIAGGYDSRLEENVSYYEELKTASAALHIPDDQVMFMRNVSDECKQLLLRKMFALLYTPGNEHFGIVPVEAMLRGKPVVAVKHGGPCESVGDVSTEENAGGLLCEQSADAFCSAMQRLVKDRALASRLGEQGKTRAETVFSIDTFSEKVATRVVRLYSTSLNTIYEAYGKHEEAGSARPVETASAAKKSN